MNPGFHDCNASLHSDRASVAAVVVGGVVVLMPVAGALNTGTSTMADADGRVPSAGEKERGIH